MSCSAIENGIDRQLIDLPQSIVYAVDDDRESSNIDDGHRFEELKLPPNFVEFIDVDHDDDASGDDVDQSITNRLSNMNEQTIDNRVFDRIQTKSTSRRYQFGEPFWSKSSGSRENEDVSDKIRYFGIHPLIRCEVLFRLFL
jgi:hypothetical protein